MKFCLVKKVADKAKEIAKKIVNAIAESNKRRAERAINWEMHQYYRNEYGHNFLEKFPYHVVNRRD
jgi:hypothetical protein